MSRADCRFVRMLVACFVLLPVVANAAITVNGYVTDAITNQPIVNATVNIWELVPDPPFSQDTYTDGNGYYQMAVPDASIVHYIVSATGYATQNQEIFTTGADPLVQDFALASAGSISGTIRAATAGNPALANVTVSLLDASSKTTIAQTTAGTDGSYSFTGLTPGAYGVCVIDPTDIYIDSCYSGNNIPADGTITLTAINLSQDSNLSGIDLQLYVGATLSGTLTDRYFNIPIANASIQATLYSSAQKQVAWLMIATDADGGYFIPGLAAGSYYLEAGQNLPNQANSTYSFQLYGGGECTGTNPPCPFATSSLVNVPPTGVSGVDFGLFPGEVVTGRVTDASSGKGVAGVTINACDNLTLMIYGVSGTTTTDANGNYTVAHVIGSYTYIAAINAPGYVGVIWPSTFTNSSDGCLGPEKSAAQQLDFTAPDQVLTGVDFGLQTGASISGTVSASDLPGNPIEANLWLYQSDGQGGTNWVATLRSDANGYFQTPGVQPGTYYIAAYYDNGVDCQLYSAAGCGAWDPTHPLSLDFSAATPIQLTAGQLQTGVSLQLKGDIFHSNFQ